MEMVPEFVARASFEVRGQAQVLTTLAPARGTVIEEKASAYR